MPGHEVSGVVAELGYGTTGLTVGQGVFGLADWARNGTLAEYVAMEADHADPRRRRQRRLHRGAARASGRRPGDRDRPSRRQRPIFFVVEADRFQLAELALRLRDGRLTSIVGAVRPLAEAPDAFGPHAPRVPGKTIIQVTDGW